MSSVGVIDRRRRRQNDKCVEVDNCVNPDVVVNKSASHFAAAYTPNDTAKADKIRENYSRMRVGYCGPIS